MRQFLALFTLFFVGCIATANLTAAPVYDDSGAINQTTIVSALDQPAVLPSFSSSNLIPASHLPGIVLTSMNNSNDICAVNSGFLPRPGHAGERTKPNANYYGNCTENGDFWESGRQCVNSNQIFVLPQATKDGNEGGNSANYNSATWTVTYDDDDGANQLYFSNTTICTAQSTSASTLPEHVLRC